MTYSLHIEIGREISFERWKGAVNSINGARIDTTNMEGINPDTDERIAIGGNKGDVAVLFESKGFIGFGKKSEWVKSIFFSNGRASFKATEDIEDTNNPVHIVASKISKSLGATIVGDEGETYKW